jgi:hypothetical protein
MSAFYSSCQSWIDKSDLTKEVILKKDTSGNFIALLATHRRNLNFLPKELITKDVLMEETLEEDPLSLTGTKKGKDLLIHQIARHGQISVIPKEELSTEILSIKGDLEESVFHIIARLQKAYDIPKEFWTKETLTLKTPSGVTPLQTIASITQEMPNDITLEDMLHKDNVGETPLHSWARSFNCINIPNKFLTRETLKLKGAYKESLLKILTNSFFEGYFNPEEDKIMSSKIAHCLSLTSDKDLDKLKREGAVKLFPLLTNEMIKRKIIKTIGKEENSIEI